MPKILDLYCGMGGLSLGFALALEEPEIIGYDIDSHAVETYNLNLSKFECKGRVMDLLKGEPERECDMIMGGVPCQPFSIANVSKCGEDHELYPTFPRFFDIILEAKPKAFMMENVKGLVSKRHYRLFDKQLSRLKDLYRVEWKVLDAADYGVPQRRERLIVIGIRKDLRVIPSFPLESHRQKPQVTLDGRRLRKWISIREAIGDLLNNNDGEETVSLPPDTPFQRKHPPLKLDEPSRAVISHVAKSPRNLLLPEIIVKARKEDIRRYRDCPSPTIANIGAGGPRYGRPLVLDGARYRRLTVKECLRLQSFPDWWTFPESVSKSRRYKLVGEAVPPILAYKLALHLAKLLGWRTREPPKPEEWDLPYFHKAFPEYC